GRWRIFRRRACGRWYGGGRRRWSRCAGRRGVDCRLLAKELRQLRHRASGAPLWPASPPDLVVGDYAANFSAAFQLDQRPRPQAVDVHGRYVPLQRVVVRLLTFDLGGEVVTIVVQTGRSVLVVHRSAKPYQAPAPSACRNPKWCWRRVPTDAGSRAGWLLAVTTWAAMR